MRIRYQSINIVCAGTSAMDTMYSRVNVVDYNIINLFNMMISIQLVLCSMLIFQSCFSQSRCQREVLKPRHSHPPCPAPVSHGVVV